MVAVVYGSDQDFSIMAHGVPSASSVNYLYSQFANIDRNMFRDTNFIDSAVAAYNSRYSDEAIAKARALLNMTDTWSDDSSVYLIKDLYGFQTANVTMQRYIMANPYVRKMYQEDRCNGYVESYLDPEPKAIREDHYDYRRVMDGVLEYVDDAVFKTTMYFEELRDDDRDLTGQERLDILTTWDILENLMRSQNKDPTDVFGGNL